MFDLRGNSFRFLARCFVSLLALTLTACATKSPSEPAASEPQQESKKTTSAPASPAASPSKAQTELVNGIASYEDGAYKTADRQLQNALSLGLEAGTDEAMAHKYLAFIHCVHGRKKQCASEFAKALAADRSFDLTPGEARHPIWGPVFRKQKAEAQKKTNPQTAGK